MPLHNEDLILNNLSLVKNIVIGFTNKYAGRYNTNDLIGFGYWGLIQAAERYNENLNDNFRNYAKTRIFGSIIDGLRKDYDFRKGEKLPVYLYDLLKNNNFQSDDNSEITENNFPDLNSEQQFLEIENKLDNQKLYEAINKLSEKNQKIIRMYYWEDKTLLEIGNEMGFSESRACQKNNEIIEKLRDDFKEEKINKNKKIKKRSAIEINEMRKLYRTGDYSMKDISKIFNLSIQCVFNVIHYKSYKEVI